MENQQFYNNDIQIADFRILLSLWSRDKGESDYFLDISSIATSDIQIHKERNNPDKLEVTIEYTQFKEKLNYEGSNPENLLMPYLTEIKILRNFKTIFAGTLFHMSLALGEVGKELLTLQCCSWGQHYEKRFVAEAFAGTYPDIARSLVLAGQHEMNWFDNYAWEYTDDYFQGWTWSTTLRLQSEVDAATVARKTAYEAYNNTSYSDPNHEALRKTYDDAREREESLKETLEDNQAPPRATTQHWDGGIRLGVGEKIWTYSMQPCNLCGEPLTLQPLQWSFWYKASNPAKITLSGHGDVSGDIGGELFSFVSDLPKSEEWTQFNAVIPSQTIEDEIHWLQLSCSGNAVEISDLNLYTKPEQGDAYDLDIKLGKVESLTHEWGKGRIRHYHRQGIKEALTNLAQLSNTYGSNSETDLPEPDTFEFEFDEYKRFNIYYQQGALVADPAFAAEYPGIIKTLTIERGLEEICNLTYASADEQKTYKDAEGNDRTITKKWTSAYSNSGSMARFGTQADFKTFESVHSYEDLDAVGGSDLHIYDEVQNIPEIEVDSNIYNMGNIHLGDAVIVNVLTDKIFEFINGVYRVYSLSCSISKDSVESVRLTLVPPDAAALQLISFPKQYKHIRNDIKRLLVG